MQSNQDVGDVFWVMQHADNSAKLHWGLSLIIRCSAFAINVLATLMVIPGQVAFVAAAIGALACEWFDWVSSRNRSLSQAVKRKLEMENWLNLKFSDLAKKDVLAEAPKSWTTVAIHPSIDNYWASTKKPGNSRAVECLSESVWFSSHLSHRMSTYCAVVFAVWLASSFLMLVLSVTAASSPAFLDNVARIVTAWIVLAFSIGLLRMAVRYQNFQHSAENVQIQLEKLVRSDTWTRESIVELIYSYQLARAQAPPIPTWLWKLNVERMNDIWKHSPSHDTRSITRSK